MATSNFEAATNLNDYSSLCGNDFAGGVGDLAGTAVRLLGDEQTQTMLNKGIDHSSMPAGMRGFDLNADPWHSSQTSKAYLQNLSAISIDAWSAIGQAASGQLPSVSGNAEESDSSRTSRQIKSQLQDEPAQLSLSSDQIFPAPTMPHTAVSNNGSGSSSSSGPTPSPMTTTSGPRSASSVGSIDTKSLPLWARRLQCDYAQARLRGQSAPDLRETFATHSQSPSFQYSSDAQKNTSGYPWTMTHDQALQQQALDSLIANTQNSMASYSNASRGSEQYASAFPQTAAHQPLSHAPPYGSASVDSISPLKLKSATPLDPPHASSEPQMSAKQRGDTTKSRRVRGASDASEGFLIGTASREGSPISLHDGMNETGAPLRSVKGSIPKVTVSKRALSHSENGEEEGIVGGELQTRHVCPHPGCNKHFSTSGHARRHSRIHDDLRPYECPHKNCHATFTRRDNCTQHQRARHGSQLPAHRLAG